MAPSPLDPNRAADREKMVADQLVRRGIRSEAVLEAMRRIPRERFVPAAQQHAAYSDGALPIDRGQTISQPYMVARMTELLEPTPTSAVLEIGTGTGYQTAILASLVRHVWTIEWHMKLMTEAAPRLEDLGLPNVTFRCGDGSLGWPGPGPFDGIMVTAGAPDVPAPLCDQLAPGGRLVVPIGPVADQTLVLVRRTEAGPRRESVIKCRFVKLLGRAGWPAE